MTQIERIEAMERLLDEASTALEAYTSDDPAAYEQIHAKIERLEAYYTGPQWMQDYDDDHAGRLPAHLKRGVLSQDAIDHLLQAWSKVRHTP